MSDDNDMDANSADCWRQPEPGAAGRSAKPRRARLSLPNSTAGRGTFMLGDLDLSMVVGTELNIRAGHAEVTSISVDIPAIDGFEFDGTAVLNLNLTDEQRLALIYAGWTPPKGQ